jgi:hypothetical protein
VLVVASLQARVNMAWRLREAQTKSGVNVHAPGLGKVHSCNIPVMHGRRFSMHKARQSPVGHSLPCDDTDISSLRASAVRRREEDSG